MADRDDSSRFLRLELTRVLEQLDAQLLRQRERGRTPAVDSVQGYVIEEGEAEGLVAELAYDLAKPIFCSSSSQSTEIAIGQPSPSMAKHVNDAVFSQVINSFDLSQAEYDALLLTLAVEVDARFGRLIAFLNDHVGRTRPTLGMMALMAAGASTQSPFIPWEILNRPLLRDGLLLLEGEGPLPGLTLRMPVEVVARLVSRLPINSTQIPFVHYQAQGGRSFGELVLPDRVREFAMAWAHQLRQSRLDRLNSERPLILVGARGSGRRSLVEAIATEASWSITVVELAADTADNLAERLRTARRESRWYGSALLLRIHESVLPTAIPWRTLWDAMQGLGRPLFLAMSKSHVELATANADQEPVVFELMQPELSQRLALWRSLLPTEYCVSDKTCETLAARFRFGPGRIHKAITRAHAQVSLHRASDPLLSELELEQACRDLGSATMGTLAQKMPLPFTRSDLVIPEHLSAEFDLALSWIRHQQRVLDQWGFAKRFPYGRGLTALFAGPPGTGKTMAAQVLSRELGIDMFRVDFSRLMSKWIGETEKNLAQLFDEAEAAGVSLFFDEGDAVAGKRSEVKDAQDRYANVEVSYLLQRMEEHEGVTIFATNRLGDLDEAFTRRFHFVLDFPKPSFEQRLKIWSGMFPPQVELAEDLDLRICAQQFELTGGEIKNVVLAAAFLAAQAGEPVKFGHILTGVRRELLKSGRLAEI